MLAHAGTNTDESVAVVMVIAALWLAWIGRSRIKGTGFGRLPRWSGFALVGAAGVLVVSATFLPRALLTPSTSVASGPRPASSATIAFVRPTDDEVVHGNDLTVVVGLTGGTIVDTSTTAVTPDTGHIHLSLDGKLVSMTYGTTQVVDLYSVAPGEHTLDAEFVAADHAPFDPRVTATVRFTKAAA